MSIETALPAPRRYLALDGLRGVAALAVLFYHLRNLEAVGRPAQADALFASGYLAVDLFFLLSGFVIAHAYGDRLGTTLNLRAFLMARLIRLQPVIALGTVIGFSVALASRMLGLPGAPGLFAIATSLPPNLLMLPNPLVPWGIFLFNPPAWSLFYELVANAAYGAVVCRKTKWKTPTRLAGQIALAAIAAAGLAGLVASVSMLGDLDRGVVLGDWPVALARIAFSFTAGLLLHHTRGLWIPVMPHLPIFVLLPTCLALLALGPTGVTRSWYDLVFVVVLSPLLVMATAVVDLRGGWARIAASLGVVSYPLYATHAPIKHLAEMVLPLNFGALFAVTSCTAVLTAWLVGAAIDPVLRQWLGAQVQSRSNRAKRSAAATANAV
jgi:peptidoglycan/LPS O-acetylase OafA/YrhL